MKNWSDIFLGRVIGRIFVKKQAHACTLLSVMWSIISLIAALACRGSTDVVGWTIGSCVWILHLAFIGAAVWFWLHEKKDTEILIRESLD